SFVGPTELAYKLPVPGAEPFKLKYVLRDAMGAPLKNTDYAMYLADGSVMTGKTNAQGETQQITTDGPDSVHLMVANDSHEGYYQVSEHDA
ncbi:type VI secretion protein, partial [Xanthomonas maliensis]